ncbi:MAG: ABC transporter ATP-binding protein [Clostridiales bacterium]|nr:ABC transporter ATP-binding protein [Clostridiales bacterium]
MAQIICKDLSLGYEGKVIAKNISFSVNAGDYLCIIGENGSGKSTLMKALLNLHAPIQGDIEFGDGLKSNEIGYLPQQTDMQRDFPASVEEIVLSGCLNHCGLRPFYTKKEKQRAVENMEKVNIGNLAKKCYRELSGGQQQRTLLARALCAAEKIILLDEPISGLDPTASAEMYALTKSLNSSGMTVIMISHDIDATLKYATHILSIGPSFFFGTKDEYLEKFPYLKEGEENE